jgi:hypothetical protein
VNISTSIGTVLHQVSLFSIGYEIPTIVTVKSSVFWGIVVCNPVEVSQRFNEHITFIFKVEEETKQEAANRDLLAFSFLAYSSALKMVVCWSEILIDFHQTMCCYIPEDRTLPILLSICLLAVLLCKKKTIFLPNECLTSFILPCL